MAIDVQMLRNDFPMLSQSMNGKKLIYLDSGATSFKPIPVINALNYYNTQKTSSVHRGVYKLSNEVTTMFEDARETVANFISAQSKEVIFTKGATESLNLVALSYGLHNLGPNDEIITSELEHHSSFLPWQNVAKVTGAKLLFIPLSEEGRITVQNFKSVLSNKTKIVALNYVSNVMGYISPIKEICDLSHEVGAVVSVDAAQASPHIKIDVKDIGCDFLSFTGHKMLGPTGIGVLFGKYSLLKDMQPVTFGGEMIDIVGLQSSTFKNPPHKFEAGTPSIAEAIGLSTAIKYLQNIGFDEIQAHESELRNYAISELSKIKQVTLFNKNTDMGIINFNVENIHPHDMATVYDMQGICVRAGHHCCQLLMKWLKQPATLRASIYLYNTKSDIDALVTATSYGKEIFNDYDAL